MPRKRTDDWLSCQFADDAEFHRYSPDGFDQSSVNRLIWSVSAEHRRHPPGEPTSWLRMPEDEKAEIRPRRRGLRLVVDNPASMSAGPDSGEAA